MKTWYGSVNWDGVRIEAQDKGCVLWSDLTGTMRFAGDYALEEDDGPWELAFVTVAWQLI